MWISKALTKQAPLRKYLHGAVSLISLQMSTFNFHLLQHLNISFPFILYKYLNYPQAKKNLSIDCPKKQFNLYFKFNGFLFLFLKVPSMKVRRNFFFNSKNKLTNNWINIPLSHKRLKWNLLYLTGCKKIDLAGNSFVCFFNLMSSPGCYLFNVSRNSNKNSAVS